MALRPFNLPVKERCIGLIVVLSLPVFLLVALVLNILERIIDNARIKKV